MNQGERGFDCLALLLFSPLVPIVANILQSFCANSDDAKNAPFYTLDGPESGTLVQDKRLSIMVSKKNLLCEIELWINIRSWLNMSEYYKTTYIRRAVTRNF